MATSDGFPINAPPLANGDVIQVDTKVTVSADGTVTFARPVGVVLVERKLPTLEVLQARLADPDHVWCELRGKMLTAEECATGCAAPEHRPVCWPGETIDDATQTD